MAAFVALSSASAADLAPAPGLYCLLARQRVEVLQMQPVTDGKTSSMGAFVRLPDRGFVLVLVPVADLTECRS